MKDNLMGDGHDDKHKSIKQQMFLLVRWIVDRASVADLGNDICTL